MKTLYIALGALVIAALSLIWLMPSTSTSQISVDEQPQVTEEVGLSSETYHKANWKLHLAGSWEWFDEGKELVFEFGPNNRFDYFEKAHEDKLINSEDRGSGDWHVQVADEFSAEVQLLWHNSDGAELIFYIASLDDDHLAVRTEDMEADTYLLFTRYFPETSDE